MIGEHIQLVTVPTLDLWAIKADPGQCQQILLNLAVNARDAMSGGGKLTIETRNVIMDEEDTRRYPEVRAGDYVMLAVTDTGIGMDETVLQHIFEPFFTSKEVGEGTGLGLAICYGIVRQSGGHIRVYSKPGEGTSFNVYFPRALEAG